MELRTTEAVDKSYSLSDHWSLTTTRNHTKASPALVSNALALVTWVSSIIFNRSRSSRSDRTVKATEDTFSPLTGWRSVNFPSILINTWNVKIFCHHRNENLDRYTQQYLAPLRCRTRVRACVLQHSLAKWPKAKRGYLAQIAKLLHHGCAVNETSDNSTKFIDLQRGSFIELDGNSQNLKKDP